MQKFAHRAALAAALALVAGAVSAPRAQDIENRLVIVTSFSKDVTEPYRTAFQKKFPGTKVEVQNRNTNAAVTFIRETDRTRPTSSGRRAGRVRGAQEGQTAAQLPAEGDRHRVEGRLLSGQRSGRHVHRLRRVRLRHHVQHALSQGETTSRAEGVGRPQEAGVFRPCRDFGAVALRGPLISPSRRSCRAKVGTRLGNAARDRAGNLAQVSDRSFGVPDAVNSDNTGSASSSTSSGLSAKASGFPVEFVYPTVTAIVPANVGIIANSRNQRAARPSVEFLLSEEGQQILLDPKIQRLPCASTATRRRRRATRTLQGCAARQRHHLQFGIVGAAL
jgi:hypothetical protein